MKTFLYWLLSKVLRKPVDDFGSFLWEGKWVFLGCGAVTIIIVVILSRRKEKQNFYL